MPNGFDLMNKAAQQAEQSSPGAPIGASPSAPAADPSAQNCQMCGAMAQHMDPEKLKAFMANNPFAGK